MWLALGLWGCAETVGEISGTVLIGSVATGDPLAGGTVQILGEDTEIFDEAPIDDQGRFLASAPLGANIYAVVEGPGMVPAGFSGKMGQGAFEVPPGALFGVSQVERDALDAVFGDCARPGPALYGEVRLYGFVDEDGVNPLVTTAYASAGPIGQEPAAACYLGAETGEYDPEATLTGPTGRFALFDVPTGLVDLDYGYRVGGSITVDGTLRLFVPDQGVTPLMPAWVDLYLP